MNDLTPITDYKPGYAEFENYDEIKNQILNVVNHYNNMVYSESTVGEIKKDKAKLNKLKKVIDDKRKEIKKSYMAPFVLVENKLKELTSLIQEPVDKMTELINEAEGKEKLEKIDEIKQYYEKNSAALGDWKDVIISNPDFIDKTWLNRSTATTTWHKAVDEKISNTSKAISSIEKTGGKYTAAMIHRFLETQDMEDVTNYRKNLKDSEKLTAGDAVTFEEDNVVGFKTLKIHATRFQMEQIIQQLNLMGVEYEELEDGMPKDFEELTKPDFDSFVAFDIETSGTFGIDNGDGPAEITEIGAVKVINGKIVETKDWLCNPGRKIVPRIARLTHITDEMVANEPPVTDVIKMFKEFTGDLNLVGHNIKSSDLHYISKAVKKAGIDFSNPFFDTYLFAKKFKASMNWESLKLEYLSDFFGISQPDAHRAYCDAQANVDVYFKLKELDK